VSEEIRSSSNPKKVREQKARDTLRADQDAEDLAWMLADPRGRRFIRSLLWDCHEHGLSFNTNAAVMGFQEGERNVALKLKARILALKPTDAVLVAVLLSGEDKP
jgi:hypothetical protein